MEDSITITKQSAKELLGQKKFVSTLDDLGVKITLKENVVTIKSESAMSALLVKNAIRAFNRGFDAKTSLLLLDDNYDLAVINIGDYTGSQKRQTELKGRIIGSRGIIKKRLSKTTSCYIKILGKTVSIIGNYQNLQLAIEAIEMLLNGAKHDSVFAMIDRKKLEAYEHGSS